MEIMCKSPKLQARGTHENGNQIERKTKMMHTSERIEVGGVRGHDGKVVTEDENASVGRDVWVEAHIENWQQEEGKER